MAGRGSDDKKQIEKFLAGADADLGELRRVAQQAKTGPLDESYEALDRLEDLLVSTKQGKHKGVTVEGIMPLAERYVGVTLIRNAGGRWDYAKMKGEVKPRPSVVGLPGIGEPFFPHTPVNVFLGNEIVGSLRENVEKYDLPRTKKEAERLVREADKEIAALAKDLGVKLDWTMDSLDALGKSIAARYEKAGRDERRRLRARGGLYLGEFLRRKTGRGTWALIEDPKLAEFGQLRLDGWASSTNIRALGVKKEPGALRTAMDYWITKAGAPKGSK